MSSENSKSAFNMIEKDVPSIPKCATGIAGLDDILHGGFPQGRMTLLQGGTGSGKTNLSLAFLYNSAKHGEPGIFVSFEERKSSLLKNALTLGWNLHELEEANKLVVIESIPDPEAIISGEFSLKGLLAQIQHYVEKIGACRLVLDAPDDLLRFMKDTTKEESELLRLNSWMNDKEITSLITTKSHTAGNHINFYEFLDYLVDCVIYLDQRISNQVTTRRLRVVKYRGSDFGRNEYPFSFSGRGLEIAPITSIRMRHQTPGGTIPSGNEKLDEILGGGYIRSSCTLISGTPGSGKTSIAGLFAKTTSEKKQKVLFISFEESDSAIVANLQSPGIDLQSGIKTGMLKFLCLMPESMGSEDHFMHIAEEIGTFNPEHLILDSLSATGRMGGVQVAFDFVFRIIDFCKQKGITLLLTNQIKNFTQIQEISGFEISSLIDSVILLRMIEEDNKINRDLLVLKSRGRRHSNQWQKYLITDNGIRFSES